MMQRATRSEGSDPQVNNNGDVTRKKADSRCEDGCMVRTDRRALAIMFVSLVIDLLAFTMILPLLPSLLDYYGHHDDEVMLRIFAAYLHFLHLIVIV